MRFTDLDIKNFFSLEEAHLDFTPGLHFVEGLNHDMSADDEDESNGAGKSSLFEALEWCLYGTVSRKLEKRNGMVNNKTGKNCRVQVRFEHNGSEYRIVRTIKDDEYGTVLRWWRDGVEQTKHEMSATKVDLKAALPVPAEAFLHAVRVGQGMPSKFLSLSETQKQDFLCEIVDLTIYDRALDRTKQRESAEQQDINLLVGAITTTREQVARWEDNLRTYQGALDQYRQQKAPDFNAVKAKIAEIDEKVVEYRRNEKILISYIEAREAELVEVRPKTQTAQVDAQKVYVEVEKAKADVIRLTKDRDQFARVPDKCPTCGKPIEKQSINVQLAKLDNEIGQSKVLQARLEKTYKVAYAKLHDAQQAEGKLVQDLTEKQGQLPQYSSYFAKMQTSRDTFANAAAEHERKIAEMEGRIATTQETIESLDAEIPEREKQKAGHEKALKHWNHLKTIIPNLRAAATAQILTYLNERVEHYMKIFSAGAMGMELVQERYGKQSKIKVDLRTPAGSYGASSGGEQRRVDLAVYMALSDLLKISSGTTCNLLVADEIMDGVSPAGIRKFVRLLREKADEGMCIFVMSHHPAVKNSPFDTTMLVEKRDGLAKLLQSATV